MIFACLNNGRGGTELNTLGLDIFLASRRATLFSIVFSLSIKRRIIFMNLDSRKRNVVGNTTLVTVRIPE